jgi:pimeloyl-ACP methyl ester carboxylesterase
LPEALGIHYEEHGGGASGPPLVLIHGAGGSRLHWPPALRRLAGHRTLAVDLPGHGESQADGTDSLGGYAQRLADWRRGLGINPAVLVGHSMGSFIALTSAFAEPSTLAGLVLVGGAARLRVNPLLLADADRRTAFGSVVDRILEWSFAADADPRLVELARARLEEAGPDQLAADLHACDGFDVTERLAEIRLPTLIVVGRSDRMTPVRLCEEMQAGIADSRLEVIEGAGHMVMLERAQAFEAALRSWLDRSPS